MTNPVIKIHNAETGEVVERPMDKQEYEAYLTAQAAEAERQDAVAQKTAARNAVLEKLGITADEVALLLG
jgi:hypothetical protein